VDALGSLSYPLENKMLLSSPPSSKEEARDEVRLPAIDGGLPNEGDIVSAGAKAAVVVLGELLVCVPALARCCNDAARVIVSLASALPLQMHENDVRYLSHALAVRMPPLPPKRAVHHADIVMASVVTGHVCCPISAAPCRTSVSRSHTATQEKRSRLPGRVLRTLFDWCGIAE
jgi:hypothetical protein